MREAAVENVRNGLPWKQTLLPAEHGGWGLLAEPIALGLVIAPSLAGLAVALGAVFGFLARHPLRLALMDRRRHVRYPRSVLAERVAAVCSVLALALLALGAALAARSLLMPFLAAAPFALVALSADARGRSREELPEAAGAVALSAPAALVALAAGADAGAAWGAFALLALRGATSVLYVRARIRLDRGVPARPRVALGAHGGALFAAGALAALRWAPWLAVLVFLLLMLRAVSGLSSRRAVVRPQVVGLQEIRYGILTVVVLALGYRLGW